MLSPFLADAFKPVEYHLPVLPEDVPASTPFNGSKPVNKSAGYRLKKGGMLDYVFVAPGPLPLGWFHVQADPHTTNHHRLWRRDFQHAGVCDLSGSAADVH